MIRGLRMNVPVNPASTSRQSAAAVLMVRPAAFGFNAEAACTNRFQRPPAPELDVAGQARVEFDGLCAALRSEGVRLCVVDDTPEPPKPDAVFPNNWISFHADGSVVLYPLQPPSRRDERRLDVLEAVARNVGFRCSVLHDLRAHEREGRFLEGTGSLVLDHVRRVAYACRSPRTDAALVRSWAQRLQYTPVIFDAADEAGVAIYHTNVLLCIGTTFAVVCSAAIAAADRDRVLAQLMASDREIIDIDAAQLHCFAANMLELTGEDEAFGDYRVLVMSAAARAAFDSRQYLRLSACVDSVLAVPIATIESVGGGSVRCMLAEVPEIT
jgi:hypothetical protein